MVLAVIVGAVLYALYGGVYYSLLLSDKKSEKNKYILSYQTEGASKYIMSILVAIISSLIVASIIQMVGSENSVQGLRVGAFIGAVISLVYVKNALFGLMPRRSLYIAIGDHLVIFTIVGIVQGILLSM